MSVLPARLLRVHPTPRTLPAAPLDPPGTHRFDDPRGEYSIRYLGGTLRACLLETMDRFRDDPATSAALAAVTGIEPDERDPSTADGLAEWLGAQRVAAFAPPASVASVIFDVNDPASLVELDEHPLVRDAIAASGLAAPGRLKHLDEALVRLDGPVGRRITQAVSRAVFESHPNIAILAYRSRHDDGEQCLAVLPRGPLWHEPTVRPLDPTLDGADVRSVAALFGVALPRPWR